MSTLLARFTVNPLVRLLFRAGLHPPATILVETVGRRTGRRRRTPVNGRIAAGKVLFLSEHGLRASYARNIAADPRVRVLVDGQWRSGTARLLPERDVGAHVGRVARGPAEAWAWRATLRLLGSDPVPVEVEID